jgi:patatin-like phospholipase/acyl hydrolase
LKEALTEVFGERLLGESQKRLVIPSFNLETGTVYIWKTAHHPRLRRDYRARVVDVALATAAAPSFFPSHISSAGVPLVDGGVWANSPAAIAVVEAIGILGLPRDNIRVLSLGCTSSALRINWARRYGLGKGYWVTRIVDLLMYAQETSANGMAEHLLVNRNDFVRVCPIVGNSFYLHRVSDTQFLRGLGDSAARDNLPQLISMFFEQKAQDDFEPYYSVRA